MEERNLILREKLKTLYDCNLAAAICLVLALIPFVNLIAVIVALVAAVMVFLAMYKLRDIHDDYNTAFMLSLMNVALSILGSIAGEGAFASLVELISALVSFAQTYHIVRGTNALLSETGRTDVMEKGDATVRIYGINLVVNLAGSVLAGLMGSSGLWAVVLVVSLVVSIAAMVYYIKYLGAAKDCF